MNELIVSGIYFFIETDQMSLSLSSPAEAMARNTNALGLGQITFVQIEWSS